MKTRVRTVAVLFALGAAAGSGTAHACATCFGASDSAMAQGMNAGILCLLGVIGSVLLGIAGFSIFLAAQSTRSDPAPRPVSPTASFDRAENLNR